MTNCAVLILALVMPAKAGFSKAEAAGDSGFSAQQERQTLDFRVRGNDGKREETAK